MAHDRSSWLTPREAADFASCSVASVQAAIKAGAVRAVADNYNGKLIEPESLQRWGSRLRLK